MQIIELDQRSSQWHVWRQKGLGSSDAAVILNGKHFGRTPQDLWEEKTRAIDSGVSGSGRSGLSNPFVSSAMQRGIDLEPVARKIYHSLIGHDPQPLCAVHDQYEWLKASMDGWIDARGIVVEIKAPKREDHQDALDGRIPEKYLAQVLHLLLVSGGKCCHYVSYSDYFDPLEQFALVEFIPECGQVEHLFQMEQRFWECVQTRTPPPVPEKRPRKRKVSTTVTGTVTKPMTPQVSSEQWVKDKVEELSQELSKPL